MNKHGRLRFAHDQLRAVFDLLIANGKAIRHRVARIVEPLNNFDELRGRAESVKNSHGVLLKVIARHYTAKEYAGFNRGRADHLAPSPSGRGLGRGAELARRKAHTLTLSQRERGI